MQPTAASPKRVRFGVFEADLEAGQLLRRGRRVALQDRPFQVLAVLLRRRGEVVTREELQQALWPADTFVEFEHGINTAVNRLRQALGDSADNPRYVETIPRKGYRFIAAVEAVAEPTPERAATLPPAGAASSTGSAVGSPAPEPALSPKPARGVPRRRRWWAVVAGVVVVAAGCVLWLVYGPGAGRASAPALAPFTSYPGQVSMASFSPDGDRIAFAWNGGRGDKFHIYVKQIGAEQPVRLTPETENDGYPAWSPDGRWIAYVRDVPNAKDEVFLMPAIGGAEHKLADTVGWPIENSCMKRVSWHPGGRWLVVPDFVEAVGSGPGSIELFLVSAENGERRRLTTPSGKHNFGFASDPAFSPDGRALVFAKGFAINTAELYLVQLSEDLRPLGEPQRITSFGGLTTGPVWWPDGKSILFSAGEFRDSILYRIAFHGADRTPGEPERVPFGGRGLWHYPAISRQGRIVYMQTRLANSPIWRLELGGSHQSTIMPMSSNRRDHSPQYSPDGKRIAFASNRSGNNEIWVCNADGSNLRPLTAFGSGPYVTAPAWSPDGRRISFGVSSGETDAIYVVGADGGKPQRLAGVGDTNLVSTWSRDGKWIYEAQVQNRDWRLWKTPMDGGAAVRVTREPIAGNAVESQDGRFVYCLQGMGHYSTTGLMRIPSPGGEAVQIAENVAAMYISVTQRGVYFFSGWVNPLVQRWNFATQKVETVGRIKTEEGGIAWGLSVSPDDRWLLYAGGLGGAGNVAESNLMLAEGYKP